MGGADGALSAANAASRSCCRLLYLFTTSRIQLLQGAGVQEACGGVWKSWHVGLWWQPAAGRTPGRGAGSRLPPHLNSMPTKWAMMVLVQACTLNTSKATGGAATRCAP